MPRIDDDPHMKAARAAVAEYLRNPPRTPADPQRGLDRQIWDSASERERREMLKECGWL